MQVSTTPFGMFTYGNTTHVPDWVAKDSNSQLPVSTDINEIPNYFNDLSISTKGLYDFGLVRCDNGECSETTRVDAIPNNANNQNIHFYVKLYGDATENNDGTWNNAANDTNMQYAIGNDTVEIKFSGVWLY